MPLPGSGDDKNGDVVEASRLTEVVVLIIDAREDETSDGCSRKLMVAGQGQIPSLSMARNEVCNE